MKWHEPRAKVRLLTTKGTLGLCILGVVFSFVLGFTGRDRKYHISSSLLALALISMLPIATVIRRLLPGYLIQLRDDAIVRKDPVNGRASASRYKDIDTISFRRRCANSWNNNFLDFYERGKTAVGGKFTNFEIQTKGEVVVDGAIVSSTFPSIGCFSVPDTVDVEKVLQILRDKGIRLIEQESAPS